MGYKAAAEAVSGMAGFDVREVEQPPMLPGGMMTNRAPSAESVSYTFKDGRATQSSIPHPTAEHARSRMAQRGIF